MRGGLLEEKMRMREEFIRQVGVEDGGENLRCRDWIRILSDWFCKEDEKRRGCGHRCMDALGRLNIHAECH